MSLITHRAAAKLGLTGRDVTLSITKVGNVTEWTRSKEYVLPLTDLEGKVWEIRVYGMNEVTADVGHVDIERVVKLFKSLKPSDIMRPIGKVDVLIGTDCCTLLPDKVNQVGNLQLMKNQFGYCLRGSHPLLGLGPRLSNLMMLRIHHASGEVLHVNHVGLKPATSLKVSLDRFFEIESLGTQCTP